MRRLLALLLLSGLTACGYHFTGGIAAMPQGVSTLQVPLFENRTSESYLHNALTEKVIQRMLRAVDVQVVGSDGAGVDAVLKGVVLDYVVEVAAYDAADLPQQYRAVVQAEAKLVRATDGRILWSGRLIQSAEFLADPDLGRQADRERFAQAQIAERLAEDLYAMVTADF